MAGRPAACRAPRPRIAPPETRTAARSALRVRRTRPSITSRRVSAGAAASKNRVPSTRACAWGVDASSAAPSACFDTCATRAPVCRTSLFVDPRPVWNVAADCGPKTSRDLSAYSTEAAALEGTTRWSPAANFNPARAGNACPPRSTTTPSSDCATRASTAVLPNRW